MLGHVGRCRTGACKEQEQVYTCGFKRLLLQVSIIQGLGGLVFGVLGLGVPRKAKAQRPPIMKAYRFKSAGPVSL